MRVCILSCFTNTPTGFHYFKHNIHEKKRNPFLTIRIQIDYVYHSTAYQAHRDGILYVTVDYDNDNIIVKDEFNFTGSSGLVTNFELTANLVDENADATKDTVEIKVSNATATDAGTFKFHVRSKR